MVRSADDAQARYVGNKIRRISEQHALMRGNRIDADGRDIIERRAQADGAGDIRRTRFELVRQVVVQRLFKRDHADHVAATLIGRHGIQQCGFAIQRADAGRPENLVSGKCVKIAIELAYVNPQMRDRLCSVEQYRHAMRMCQFDDAFYGRNCAERIRQMCNRNQFCARIQ